MYADDAVQYVHGTKKQEVGDELQITDDYFKNQNSEMLRGVKQHKMQTSNSVIRTYFKQHMFIQHMFKQPIKYNEYFFE